MTAPPPPPPEEPGAGERLEQFFRRSSDRLKISGFRKFILRGNVIDLAVGVVIGAAFTAVINALVRDFLTPVIGVAVGGHTKCTPPVPPATTQICTTETFAERSFTVNGSVFQWGDFVNNVLSLVLIGLALYYFVVLPVNHLMERFKPETEPGKQTKVCPECKSSIPYDATRCAFCTVEQPPLHEAELNTG